MNVEKKSTNGFAIGVIMTAKKYQLIVIVNVALYTPTHTRKEARVGVAVFFDIRRF
jgi:hypothetical protein